MSHKKHVVVLMGGWSGENEVSFVSGTAVSEALKKSGYEVTPIIVTMDLPALINELTILAPDVVFNAMHGTGGEDGHIQSLLDSLGLTYTHSGQIASALAMDKRRAKNILATYGMPIAADKLLTIADLWKGSPVKAPFVMKPNDSGSSLDIHIIRHLDELPAALENYDNKDTEVMIERYIAGREFTVTVMQPKDEDEKAKALAVTEIRPKENFFDYKAKYTNGKTEHILPAQIPQKLEKEAKRLAELAHETLGCSGITRTDFRYDEAKDSLIFLEINTQPGLTPLSLAPEQAEYCGIDFEELCTWIVEEAKCHI